MVRIGAIGVGIIGVVVSFFMFVMSIVVSANGPRSDSLLGSSIILFFSSIGECLFAIAAVEFVKVILDIEENTRSLLEFARQSSE